MNKVVALNVRPLTVRPQKAIMHFGRSNLSSLPNLLKSKAQSPSSRAAIILQLLRKKFLGATQAWKKV